MPSAPPSKLIWLSYAWLAEGLLLFRFGRAIFSELGKVSGPGTGGAILLFPVGAAAFLLAPLCLFFALALHQSFALGLLKVVSGLGTVGAALIGGPVALVVFIAVVALLYMGYVMEAIALVALPAMFVATLVILHLDDVSAWVATPGGRAPLFRFAIAAGVAFVAVFYVLPFAGQKAAQVSAASERATEDKYDRWRKRYTAAIEADDAKALEDSEALKTTYQLPNGNVGTAIELAIARHKINAVKTLARHEKKRYLEQQMESAMRNGDAEIWRALAEVHAPVTGEHALIGALDREADLAALQFVIASGADKNAALEAALDHYNVQRYEEKLRWLLDAGADPNAKSRSGEPLLFTAVRNGDATGVRVLLQKGARADGALAQVRQGGMDEEQIRGLLAGAAK